MDTKTLPPTVTPKWGTWFFAWLDASDGYEAFDIWKDEMYSDYEWFECYYESDDYDICVVIDWYYEWYIDNPIYRILFCSRFPSSIPSFLQRDCKRYWQTITNQQTIKPL